MARLSLLFVILLSAVHTGYGRESPNYFNKLRMKRGAHEATLAAQKSTNQHALQKRHDADNAAAETQGHVIVKRSHTADHIDEFLRKLPSQSLPHLLEKRFFSTSSRSLNKRRYSSSQQRRGSSASAASSLLSGVLGDFEEKKEQEEADQIVAKQSTKDRAMEQKAVVNSIIERLFFNLLFGSSGPKIANNDEDRDDEDDVDGDDDADIARYFRRKRGGAAAHGREQHMKVKRFDTSFLFGKSHAKHHEHAENLLSSVMASRDKRLEADAVADELVEEVVLQSPLHDRDEGISRAEKRNGGNQSSHFGRAARRSGAHGSEDAPVQTTFDLIPRHPLSIKRRRSGPRRRKSSLKGPMILGQKRSISKF